MAKEACSYGKRGLVIWIKRPIQMPKEAYSYGKRGLVRWQTKKAYLCGKEQTHLRAVYPEGKQKILFPLHNEKNNVPSTILVYPEGKQKKGLLVCKKEAYLMGKRGIFA